MSGQQRRDAGANAVLAAATVPHRSEFREHAERAIAAFAWGNDEFTADDVHAVIPAEIQPHSPNVLPAVILSAARRGVIHHVGWRKSTRPSRHASVQRVWQASPHREEHSSNDQE